MAAPIPLAEVSDLADWLGEPISGAADVKRAEWALRAASALVREASGRTWLDDDGVLVDPLPDPVTIVTLSVAARGYTNPRGAEDVSEGIDDYNHRERIRVDEAGFFLTASEREMLGKYRGTRFGGVGRISTTRGDIGAPDDRRWVVNGPDPDNPWDGGWLP